MSGQDGFPIMPESHNELTTWTDQMSMDYHMKQWCHPKESTKAFSKYFRNDFLKSSSIIDIGAGAGAATFFLANQFPEVNFTGIDYSDELVTNAREALIESNLGNLTFESGDWFNLDKKYEGGVDGVISLQTLSWLPEMETPMTQIFTVIRPKWIGLSSLFYEGDISCRIEVDEHTRERKTFYNVYSIKKLNRLAKEHGYEVLMADRFDIGIDILKPVNVDLMGTYTEKVQRGEDHQRLQISGPLLMNWYFVSIRKIR